MDLASALAAMAQDYDLAVTLIVGRDGLLVEGHCDNAGEDLEAIAAGAARALADLNRMSTMVRGGNLSRIRASFDRYQLLIDPITEEDILVAGVASGAGGERLLDALAAYRKPVLAALRAL
jgi:predicted regulator of Ras-like GTPase activity (Roadblock/LC7/MglB family)